MINSDSDNFYQNPDNDNFLDETLNNDAENQVAEIELLDENLLTAMDALNSERDRIFGIETVEDVGSFIEPVSVDTLVLHAQKNGIGSLLSMFKDAISKLGYAPASGVKFMHQKSGVIVKL